MPTIIKKGTNPSAFRLKTGYTVVLQPDIMCTLSDQLFDALMTEYGAFINERRITDKNPSGCFIIHDSREYAADMSTEVADEITDGSAPIKVTKKTKKK